MTSLFIAHFLSGGRFLIRCDKIDLHEAERITRLQDDSVGLLYKGDSAETLSVILRFNNGVLTRAFTDDKVLT